MFVNLMVLMSRAQSLEIIESVLKDLHNVMHITELQSLSSRNPPESASRILYFYLRGTQTLSSTFLIVESLPCFCAILRISTSSTIMMRSRMAMTIA